MEVETTAEVDAATARLSELGLFTQVEKGTNCCYALQDKVWVHGPGAEPWEVYTVKADAPEATSIHPAGVPPTTAAECLCGAPTIKRARRLNRVFRRPAAERKNPRW